jgi:hypothetical protein
LHHPERFTEFFVLSSSAEATAANGWLVIESTEASRRDGISGSAVFAFEAHGNYARGTAKNCHR